MALDLGRHCVVVALDLCDGALGRCFVAVEPPGAEVEHWDSLGSFDSRHQNLEDPILDYCTPWG